MRSITVPRGAPNEIQQFARDVIETLKEIDVRPSTTIIQSGGNEGNAQAPGAYFALSADLTLSLNSLCRWLIFSVSGARNLTLPVAIRGGWVGICNDNTGTLAVKDGATTLVTLSQNECCWIRVMGDGANGFQWPDKVYKEKLDGTFTPGLPIAITSGGTGLSSAGTANQILGMNSGASAMEWKSVLGTTNQVTVTHAANSITLSTPQNIHTGASPTFAGLTLSGLGNTRVVYSSSGVLTASANMTFDGSQLALAAAGASGGILVGTDVQLYRSAANIWTTPDYFVSAGPNHTSTSANQAQLTATFTFNPSGNTSGRGWGLYFTATAASNNNFTDATSGISGLEGTFQHTGSGTITQASCGIFGSSSTSTGTITTGNGLYILGFDGSTGATVTTWNGVRSDTCRLSGAGTVTTAYAFVCHPRTVSTGVITNLIGVGVFPSGNMNAHNANSQTRFGVDIGAMPNPGAFTGTTTAAIRIQGTGGSRDAILFSDTRLYRSAANTLYCDQIFQVAKAFTSGVVTLTDAATIATDASQGNHFRVTLGGNRTLGNPTNPTDGQKCTWELIQDGTGSRTITLDTQFALGTDITAVTLTTTASKRDFLGCIYNSTATKWYVVSFVKGY